METLSIPINELLEKAPNHTINELAALYSVDYGTIYRTLARYQVKAKSVPTVIDEKLNKEVLEKAFEEPKTLQEVADSLNVGASQVSIALKRHGLVSGRKKTVKRAFVGDRAFAVLGYLVKHPEESLASVGRRFSVTREYIRQVKECAVREGLIKNEAHANEQ